MWYLYILRCSDNSLYTGITTNLNRRMSAHRGELPGGARYLRGRTPFEMVFSVEAGDKSSASKLEARIKKLSKTRKENLVTHKISIEDLDRF